MRPHFEVWQRNSMASVLPNHEFPLVLMEGPLPQLSRIRSQWLSTERKKNEIVSASEDAQCIGLWPRSRIL
jgi:hypothetical protein